MDQDEVIVSFKKWFNKEVQSDRRRLFLLSVAYYYRLINGLDSEWIPKIFEVFKKSDNTEELAVTVCCGTNYLDKNVVGFITEKNMLKK